nr:zinc finger, RING/FYVE/PHD-type [Tanacetum cinerariifolium]
MEFKYEEEEEEEVIDFEEDFRQVEELTPQNVSSWIGEDGKEMHGVMVINDVLDYPKSKCEL